MSQGYGYIYSNTCSNLRTEIQTVRSTISVAENNKAQRENCIAKKTRHTNNLRLCNHVIESVKPLIGKTKDYLAEKKKDSLHNLNNALRVAGEIVPDSAKGIKFDLDSDSATVVTDSGCDVEVIEGGGYRQTSSVLICSIILQSAQQYLQTMILDEMFSLLNRENSATLSLCLQMICEKMQVISIEQKDEVYSNIDHLEYTFSKSEVWTVMSSREKKVHEEGDLDEIQAN